ncbi:MAG: DUF6268 family outer membrane beta-barrel protein [Breznakibacter sp.]
MKYFIIFQFLLISIGVFAQSSENYNISLEGHWVVDDNSDAAFQSHGIRIKLLSKPFQQGKKGTIRVNAIYNYVEINYNENSELFSDLEHFHSVGFTLGYIKPFQNPRWTFVGMAIPVLNSNFTGGVSSRDLYINALLLFNYSKQKDTRFTMGLVYTSTFGYPAPIPVFSYWREWNKKWEMNFGFPKIDLIYHLNPKTSFMSYCEMQGFNGNISKSIHSPIFEDSRTARRISYSDILAGLEWQYKLNNLQFRFNTSYTLYREFELQNTDYKTAYDFDMGKNFNIGVGIDYKF